MSTDLATLAADPCRLADVAPEALPALLGELEALRAALWVRVAAHTAAPAPIQRGNGTPGEERLLTAAQVAVRLGVSRRWVYRKAATLPFTRCLGPGTLRFSERGLERWEEARR